MTDPNTLAAVEAELAAAYPGYTIKFTGEQLVKGFASFHVEMPNGWQYVSDIPQRLLDSADLPAILDEMKEAIDKKR